MFHIIITLRLEPPTFGRLPTMMCLVVVDVAVAPNGGGKGRPTLLFSLRSV